MKTCTEEIQKTMTPAQARAQLEQGNARFVAGRGADRDLLSQVRETSGGQFPFAAVLSCIDSRASAELVFDQGIGDIFSARVAGNVVNEDILGSLEFACEVAGSKLVVVLGHSRCGAVKGACSGVELGNLTSLLAKIAPVVDAVAQAQSHHGHDAAGAEFVDAVGRENVTRSIAALRDGSKILRDLAVAGTIEIVGAYYDVDSGEVEFVS
jgi:carbonic anhydrase